MDANDTRYRSLVTANDWTLQVHSENGAAEWSEELRGLSLKPRLFEFASSQGMTPPLDEPGRLGAFDSHGNLYSLSANRRTIRVRSTATRALSDYWPVGEGDGVGAIEGLSPGSKRRSPTLPGSFGPQAPEPLAVSHVLDALTVTNNNYLIVASREAGGLLVFDLFGGGPPLFQPWPAMMTWPVSQAVTALAPLADGGFVALAGNWIHRFGSSLKPLVPSTPTDNPFAPLEAASRAAESPSAEQPGAPPCFIELTPILAQGANATALAVEGERLVVLSCAARAGNVSTYVSVLNLDGRAQNFGRGPAEPAWHVELTSLVAGATQLGQFLSLASYTLTVTTLGESVDISLFVPLRQGDQALRFVVTSTGTSSDVRLSREFWPLRRYEGLGFAVLPRGRQLAGYPDARAFYVNQTQWAPLLQLARPRFHTETVLSTPIWDGGGDGCEWHRLLLDMNLPSGTAVTVETRTCDGSNRDAIEREAFRREPDLIRSARGREQPWRDAEVDEITQGFATWETLLQAAKGRWFQVRLSVKGDGQRSPVLRSLRVWYPRFSYAKNYLPPVYREDAVGADFLDRFLALFEGEFTRWEDRIAAAQLLFDARTAPTATLEWLATWLGLAFDAADTDAARRRLLIRHAVTGYSKRGSVLGMLSAATLAWEKDIKEAWLAEPDSLLKRRNGVRIQEFFSQVGALPPGAWLPSKGRDALLTRLTPTTATGVAPATAVDAGSLVSSGDDSRKALLQSVLSFVPRAASEEARIWDAWQTSRAVTGALPSDELPEPEQRSNWSDYLIHTQSCAPLRQRWQDFLSRRYRRIAALNADWGTSWSGFQRIPSPIVVPRAQAALEAWHRFETRVLRGQTHAHRFRVVLPLPREGFDVDELLRRRDSVRRVVESEKPAHTVAEVRFGFELFRVGEARLGRDTQLEEGLSKRPELQAMSRAILGRTELGSAKLEQVRPLAPPDRVGLNRRESLNR